MLEAHTQSAMAAVALAGKERAIFPLFWGKCGLNHTVHIPVNHTFYDFQVPGTKQPLIAFSPRKPVQHLNAMIKDVPEQ